MTVFYAFSADDNTASEKSMFRRISIVVLSVGLLFGLLAVPAGISDAASSPVPAPGITLPPQLDWEPEYHGQTLCSPTPKPGTLKLAALLDQTYGSYTKYFTGSPCPNGLEHQEGRAIDWMVNSADPAQKAKAEAFIAWLLAPGPNGEPGANARRLGILYLVWNNRIWGAYRQQDGWRNYSGCTAAKKKSKSYNTSCHRDHVHISMTWDGANAQTSFWSGQAETRGPCPSSTVSRPGGSGGSPVTLLNTASGEGLGASACRLAGNTRYTARKYTVKVPVPTLAGGQAPSQLIQINRFQLNAPTSLKIRSANTIRIPQGTPLPVTVSVPLRADGAITFSLDGGYAEVFAVGLGAGNGAQITQISKKAELRFKKAKRRIRAGKRVKIKALIAGSPAGSQLVVRRKAVRQRQGWRTVHRTPVSDGKFRKRLRIASVGKYRFVLKLKEPNGKVIAKSRKRTVRVR